MLNVCIREVLLKGFIMKTSSDLGILVIRVLTSVLMIFPHGWSKLINFSSKLNTFPDPLGISSPLSLSATVFTEVFCSAAIIVGIKTRWAALALFFTMIVAAFVVHGQDPWMRKEKALLYAVVYLGLFFSGGGRYSVKD